MTIALLFAPAEDRAVHPLFARRPAGRCAWPLWQGGEPLHAKRCCGAPADPARPYCAAHEAASVGEGTSNERRVVAEAVAHLSKGRTDA